MGQAGVSMVLVPTEQLPRVVNWVILKRWHPHSDHFLLCTKDVSMSAVICALVPLRPNDSRNTSEGRAINPRGGTQQRASGSWLLTAVFSSGEEGARAAEGRGRRGEPINSRSKCFSLPWAVQTHRAGRAIVISKDTVYSPGQSEGLWAPGRWAAAINHHLKWLERWKTEKLL